MKKALFLALISMLVATIGIRRADARGTITVINDTNTGAAIQLNFYSGLCRDDHVNVAPHGRFVSHSGLCENKSFLAQIADAKGVSTQCQGSSGANTFALFRIFRGPFVHNPFTKTDGPPEFVCGIRHN